MPKAKKAPVVVQDDDDKKVTLLNPDAGHEDDIDEDSGIMFGDLTLAVTDIKLIKGIITAQETAKFHQESASGLKKTLVKRLKTKASVINEIISVIKKETDSEAKESAIDQKRQVVSASEQCLAMYNSVTYVPGELASLVNSDGKDDGGPKAVDEV